MENSNVAIRKVNLKIAENVLLPDTKIQSTSLVYPTSSRLGSPR